MDKLAIMFFADILYVKGIICFDEYEAIGGVKDALDLDIIIDKMLRGDFDGRRKGETYIDYAMW